MNKLEQKFHDKLLSHLSDHDTKANVNNAVGVCKDFSLSFLTFFAENEDQYWESFLACEYETDKSLDWVERVKDCRKRFPQTWNKYREGEKKETVDYYKLILKSKYACFGN
jgi:hypothetical protein